ncbi:MAG: hypothetical protein CMO80_04630 [Verrucomicrobiales bacterium]|nr:hypothetical protein [Verrucomicrobiales bacterium]
MAEYEIIEQEGVRLVKVTLNNEMIRCESGALYYMRGAIEMESKAPSIGGFFKSLATGESIFRPTYTGTGELYLEPSMGGFHVMELEGDEWILESGAYWASDPDVKVDAYREKTLTSLKSGEGFLDFQTKVSGYGKVVLSAQGPVEAVHINNDKLVVDGNYVLARPSEMKYSAQRATKSLLGSLTSGEGFVRIYEGTGTVLMAAIPYWRYRLHNSMLGALSNIGSK